MPEYKLPDVGEGLTEAEVVTWKVKVGDVIKINDVVVEIETAKSLVELPSPYAGTVQALLVPEGETVPVGTPLIQIGEAASGAGEAPSAPAPTEQTESDPYLGMAEKAGAADRVVEPADRVVEPADRVVEPADRVVEPADRVVERADRVVEPVETIDMSNPAATGGGENQTLVGYGPRTAAVQRRPRRGGASPATEAGAAAQRQLQGAFTPGGAGTTEVEEADEPAVPSTSAASTGRVPTRALAKPPVRKLAKDLGVDLRTLTPTGPDGTVTREDVQAAGAATAQQSRPSEAIEAVEAAAPARAVSGVRETREPIKGVRKMMAQAMVDSAFSAPHVTEWITVDVTRTMKLVEKLKRRREFHDVKVSPLLVVAKAVCLAMRRTPEINATWDDASQEVVLKSYVNLGIAAATPRGLVVPNIKDADALALADLGSAINALTRTAREGKTQPAEMSGGTFTITNVGVFGVDAGTPIINPGESAILCFGAVRQQPWVHSTKKGAKIKVREVTTLALSFDHRIVDGEKGSRFLADVAAVLEDPSHALLL